MWPQQPAHALEMCSALLQHACTSCSSQHACRDKALPSLPDTISAIHNHGNDMSMPDTQEDTAKCHAGCAWTADGLELSAMCMHAGGDTFPRRDPNAMPAAAAPAQPVPMPQVEVIDAVTGKSVRPAMPPRSCWGAVPLCLPAGGHTARCASSCPDNLGAAVSDDMLMCSQAPGRQAVVISSTAAAGACFT